MKKNCKKCGAEFEIEDPANDMAALMARWVVFCRPCADDLNERQRREATQRQRDDRFAEWVRICPPAFLETETEKLPDPKKAEEVLAWVFSPRGLVLIGETRKGKSRCAWLLCRREFMAGRSVRVLDAMAGFDYAAQFNIGGAAAQEWVMKYARSGVVFMDDIFKVKLTDSFEAAIFAIVDYRLAHKLPIISTLNDTGETLAARMTADRGNATVARLREMCGVIKF